MPHKNFDYIINLLSFWLLLGVIYALLLKRKLLKELN